MAGTVRVPVLPSFLLSLGLASLWDVHALFVFQSQTLRAPSVFSDSAQEPAIKVFQTHWYLQFIIHGFSCLVYALRSLTQTQSLSILVDL